MSCRAVWNTLFLCGSLAGTLASAGAAAAQQSVADFYHGKTINLYIGFSPGGGYDAYARLVARFMSKYIPGNPAIQPMQMAGGGSRVATNYVYNIAPKDGTALATADQSFPLEQAIGDPTVLFDANKLAWIGNPDADNNTVVTWFTSGIKTIEDAQKNEVPMGATGYNTSSQYVQAMNTIDGTKFKIILGYPGGADINLAMEKGEVAGRGSNSWASWKATEPDWVRDHKLNVLVQIGLSKARDLPDVPLLTDIAVDATDRAALKVLSAPPTIGRPIFTSPGVPPERVAALRAAFDAVMKDPAFLQQAQVEQLDINPVSGADLQQIVADIVSTPKATIDRLSAIITLPEQAESKKK
jgi:tripartite-type tricarboxylate transporter receptor subunit TctC